MFSGNNLHDRYVIVKDRFFIIGYGIKDLGSKELLIVVVKDRYRKDIRENNTSVFNQRWANPKHFK